MEIERPDMFLAAILTTFLLFPRPAAVSDPAQELHRPGSQESAATAPAKPAAKPCTSPSSSSPNADCKPQPKKHSPRRTTPPNGAGPTKTVIHNGSTTDPTMALSPDLTEQQVARRMHETDQLLASADTNLKDISGRQLSTAQQDAVAQIKSFMEQARAASSSGDVQRAYNLANKANMLSADLKGH